MTPQEAKQTEAQDEVLRELGSIVAELERTSYAVEQAEDEAEEALEAAEKWCKANDCDAVDNAKPSYVEGSMYASVLEDVGNELEGERKALEEKA